MTIKTFDKELEKKYKDLFHLYVTALNIAAEDFHNGIYPIPPKEEWIAAQRAEWLAEAQRRIDNER